MAAIFSMVLLAIYAPSVTAFVGFSAISFTILFTIYKSLKSDYIKVFIKYKPLTYERQNDAAAFWFFVLMFICCAIVIVVIELLFLLHKCPGER